MRTAGVLRTAGIIALAGTVAAAACAAPTGEQIMKKAQAAINGASTYQATYVMKVGVGASGGMQMVMHVKAIPGKKVSVKMEPMGIQMVDDGTAAYTYIPAMKQYTKSASKPTNLRMSLSKYAGVQGGGKLRLLRTEKVSGRPAWVVQAAPSGGKAPKGSSVLFYVDQKTYRVVQLKASGTGAPRMAGGASAAPQHMTMLLQVKSEKLNAPIPASTFKFTPPPGSTEMKRGPRPPGPGGPGR
ncbi:MAG: hypothetical protein IT208_03085 [Chthonomonadales bacterium]|nr:hypothetical protein [Chthonomonadales bacterium]